MQGASNGNVLVHSVPHNPASDNVTFVSVPPPPIVQTVANPLHTFDPFGSIQTEARSDQPNNNQLVPGRLGQEVSSGGPEGGHRPE